MGTAKRTTSPRPRSSGRSRPRPDSTHGEVEELLRRLDHPLSQEIDELRRVIREVSPAIHESVKWNAPSFHTTEHFATFNLRARDRVNVILHTGAKRKAGAPKMQVADPAGLLKWLGDDRCLVSFFRMDEIRARRSVLQAILREWIARLPAPQRI